MRLISAVSIQGFRSIRESRIDNVRDLTCVVGINNAGKSNFLKALNAFFAGETDPGRPINVDEDYFRPELRVKRRKKQIRITVEFELPPEFRFRQDLAVVQSLLGRTKFEISKVWERNSPLPTIYLNGAQLSDNDAQLVSVFLRLIKFRYIPNRVLPIDVIRAQHSELKDLLIRRIGKTPKKEDESFAALRKASERMTAGLAQRLSEADLGLGKIQLATPSSWRDLALSFAYRMTNADFEIDDTYQGSGIQSLLMLETLFLIDNAASRTFGWQQAAIWAFEEPESSLHSSLEAQVAAYLSEIATAAGDRLQVFCTSHSELMMQYSDAVVIATKKQQESSFIVAKHVDEALIQCAKMGVSRFAHPILHYPTKVLILVEGKYDYDFINEILRILQPKRPLRIATLSHMEGPTRTGGDDLISYVKANSKLIKNRSRSFPVVLLLDWDKKGKSVGLGNIFSSDDPFRVEVWPAESANPKLGVSFRGIERFYPDRIIQEGILKGAKIGATGNDWILEAQTQDTSKQILNAIVKAGLGKDDLLFALPFVRSLLVSLGLLDASVEVKASETEQQTAFSAT
ncbi:MAG: ATP-dependent nuclease [Acidobacteriaceae bacterium]